VNKKHGSGLYLGLISGLAAIVALSFLPLVFNWQIAGQSEMSLHGYIAFAIGVALTAAVGGGLMFLVIYSNRSGYDDIDREN